MKNFTVWNSNININDWDLDEILDETNLDADDIDGIENYIYELNNEYLYDERANCDIEVPEGLVIFAESGRWNGTISGIVSVEESNIGECFKYWSQDWDDMKIEVNDDNDLVIIGSHHDGTDYYTIRKWKSAEIGEKVICMLDDGEIEPRDTYKYTESVGDLVKKVYGWS